MNIMLTIIGIAHIFFMFDTTINLNHIRDMPTFTMTLKDDAAQRVRDLTHNFGGSIAGFAASLASDVSELPPEEIVRLRTEIQTRIRIHKRVTAEKP